MTDELLTISAFARQVGLTPSALRFYDDCGLLRPASVDEQNGYRYYAPSQEARAALLRDLREIDLPLAEVRVVLDEGAAAGVAVVQAHLKTVEGKAEAARRATARILASLPAVPYECAVTLGGAELASAIRQVAAAAAESDEIPALACVFLELGEDEVAVVATDRYRLSVRKLQPLGFAGYPRNLLVRASELTALARWVGAAVEVRLETGPGGTALLVDGESRVVSVVDEEFPAYQSILDGLTPPACRVVVDRQQFLALLTGETVALDIESGKVTVTAVEPVGYARGELLGVLEGIGSGAAQLGFSASLLAAALSVSVGPDVLLELTAVDRPVVVRSADQGTFTTLVMPTRLDG
ncbi:MerR family transcriptional regulator [Kribbella sp. NPDC051718]|uniref:DNA polymerase III subunit beta family protein n=1 Tax=Kribbella sp. NPDC051718 TaxID=3155168 RepID=UPI0034387F07